MQRLEPCTRKRVRTVLRGGGGGNAVSLLGDPESRLTDVQYPATPSLNVHVGYDAYGRANSISDGTGSRSYSFDDLNSLTQAITTYTGLAAQTLSYGFYPDGSRASLSTPAGSFSYGYDADGRPNSLTNPYNETAAWTYLDNSWLLQQQSKNASASTIATAIATYNARGLLTDWTNKNASSSTLSDYGSQVYDGVGNRTSMTSSLPLYSAYSGLTSYVYDSKDQLTQEQSARSGGYTDSFVYDPAGNATTFKGASLGYNADNQNSANSYDGNGDPTTYKASTLTFDPENRLTAYGSLLTAGYTAGGLRAWKQNSSGKTYCLYDGGVPVCELNSSGSVTAVNTFGANGLLSRHSGGSSVFYTFDPSSNVAQRLDASGTVLASYMFDGFGTRGSTDNSSDPFSGYVGQWGYYSDWETGL